MASRPAHVRRANIDGVLGLIRQAGQVSKVGLARTTGISTTTMTKLFSELEETGLIEKAQVDRTSFGRPRTLYRLSTSGVCILAATIDIDETNVAVFGLDGAVNEKTNYSFKTGKVLPGFYNRLAESMKDAIAVDGRVCLMSSVCLPGLIDSHNGKSVFCPNIHWLEGTAPAQEIGRRLDLSTQVLHEEKALSFALREKHRNRTENFVLLDFSSGVGAGIFCDGHLMDGQSGFAGEIGHITVEDGGSVCGCGNHGCLETVASDRSYFKWLKQMSKSRAMERVLKYQAIGIAAAINLFNPQIIYIHTALSDECSDYLDRIIPMATKRALAPSACACLIELAEVGKLYGTALHAIDSALSPEQRIVK